MYALQENNSYCVLWSFSSALFFIGNKIAADYFQDAITPYLKASNRFKFAQEVALNCVREKVKPKHKLSYKVLKEEDGYDPLIDISPYPKLIQLKYSI